ncbi:MAG: hypothetical protein DI535_12600 [Citrobacter freundii]|nr:MAG: hypothetical protein DI535_12600 [Citrobacter freundii]
MKFILFGTLLGLFFINNDNPVNNTVNPVVTDSIPSLLKGEFVDDYDIHYTVSDSLFFMHPRAKYHIIKWNTKDQYFIARNDTINPSEKGLYSRIDYMYFENMAPWGWGFCLTVYDAKTDAQAETQAVADRKNPKKGCNGFPFSRMKRVGKDDVR